MVLGTSCGAWRAVASGVVAVLLLTTPAALSAAAEEATPSASPTVTRHPNPADVRVPGGFRLEVVAAGIEFASDITFDG